MTRFLSSRWAWTFASVANSKMDIRTLPKLGSVPHCVKCGAGVDSPVRYMPPGEGVTKAGMVPGAMIRICRCGFLWSERPLDVQP